MIDGPVGTPEGGTPTPSATPIATPSPTPTVTPNPAPAPGNNSGEDWERRFKGIQGDLAKERKARQEYEKRLQQQETTYQANLDAERRRVAALAGVNVTSPEEQEANELRGRLAKVATPEWLLSQLGISAEELQGLKAAQGDRQRLTDIERHYWGQHGDKMVKDVTTALAKEYGSELSKRQIDTITRAYVLRAQQDPEFLERHEAFDPTLIADFTKEWVEDWYEPAKRRVLSAEAGRFRPVPSGKDRSLVNQGEKKIDVNDPKAVEDLLVAGYRERSGEFGRRR